MLPASITLFPSQRVGGLRSAANSLEEVAPDWTRGLYVGGAGCLAPARIGPCAVGDADSQSPSAVQLFKPATIRQIVRCSRLGGSVGEFASRAREVTVEYAMAAELFDGQATSNPSLSGSVTHDLGTALLVVEALACIEAAAAEALSGRIAFIHVPAGIAAYLPSNLWRDDRGRWRTLAGNVLVISPGYTGSSIYATGEVWAAIGGFGLQTYLDRADNTDEAWADALALAVFDPCFVASIDTSVTCPSESD